MKITPEGFAVLENDTHVSRWVEQSKRLDHDQNIMPTLLPLIHPGDVVVDVGAFIGDHTCAYLKAVGPSGVVYAFEPNPAAYECLERNCPATRNFNMALGDYEGTIDLDVNPNAGATSIRADHGNIPIRTLDSFGLSRLSFLKIDAEGFECKVLAGGRNTILRCRPIMYVEVAECHLVRQGDSREKLLSMLADLGYRWEGMWGITDFTLPQFDLICYPL